MNKRNILLGVIIIAVFGGGYYVMNQQSEVKTTSANNQQEQSVKKEPVTVEVIKPGQEMHKANMTYKATIEASNESIISSQATGKVIRVLFEEGQKVAEGTLLVMLDDRNAQSQAKIAKAQLESTKATLKKLEANIANVKVNYDRAVSLYAQNSLSKAELDNSKTAYDSLKADIDAAKGGIASAEGNVELTQTALSNTVIKAVSGGVIANKNVKLGQFISPEMPLAKIMNVSEVSAVFEVDQNAIAKIKEGQSASLRIEGVADKTYSGKLSYIDLSADPTSRVFKVKMKLKNVNNELRPGVFAWVDLASQIDKPIITLPIELVAGKEGAYTLFVNDNGIARKKVVLIGDVIENRVEILSGITANDQVITTNLGTLQDGDPIVITVK